MDAFEKRKRLCLAVDCSRKGSIDEFILPLVEYTNSLNDYFTTSSCSGRMVIFENSPVDGIKKKGCKWLFTSHDITNWKTVEKSLEAISGRAILKFEPFVLHIQCRDIPSAQKMHAASIASGFRNSGITISKKGKIMAAIRSTQSMEVPLSKMGELMVTNQYIKYLIEIANEKMRENFIRIERFFLKLKECTSN